ncbi:MAG: hypothetical protein ACHREM_04810 [Polyangiales bacterium]
MRTTVTALKLVFGSVEARSTVGVDQPHGDIPTKEGTDYMGISESKREQETNGQTVSGDNGERASSVLSDIVTGTRVGEVRVASRVEWVSRRECIRRVETGTRELQASPDMPMFDPKVHTWNDFVSSFYGAHGPSLEFEDAVRLDVLRKDILAKGVRRTAEHQRVAMGTELETVPIVDGVAIICDEVFANLMAAAWSTYDGVSTFDDWVGCDKYRVGATMTTTTISVPQELSVMKIHVLQCKDEPSGGMVLAARRRYGMGQPLERTLVIDYHPQSEMAAVVGAERWDLVTAMVLEEWRDQNRARADHTP